MTSSHFAYPRQPHSLAPALCGREAEVPILKLESRVPCLAGRMIFLGRDDRRAENIAVASRIVMSIRGHELGRLENDL